jgi:hypothetical protein
VAVDPKRTAVVLIEYPMFSEVMTSSAFADELQGAPVA